jgi:hypothetical protein
MRGQGRHHLRILPPPAAAHDPLAARQPGSNAFLFVFLLIS